MGQVTLKENDDEVSHRTEPGVMTRPQQHDDDHRDLTCFLMVLAIWDSTTAMSRSTLLILCNRSSFVDRRLSSNMDSPGVGEIASTCG